MNPNTPQQIPVQTQPGSSPALPPMQSQTPAPFPEQQPQASTAPQQKGNRNPNSTQNTLLISEIRESMLIMNDGSFRAVITCESINFDLMSGREREGVEFSYQSFLNSLYFPVQIFIRSERVDIGPYLEKLVGLRRSQDNMLLGMLMEDYIGFIENLSQETNIMDKHFYIVVPFFSSGDLSALATVSKSIFTAFAKPQEQQHIKIDQAAYSKAKEELGNRLNAVMSGLYQMGVKAKQLSTNELSALYYNTYNPDTAIREPISNPNSMTGTYIQQGTGTPPMQNPTGGV